MQEIYLICCTGEERYWIGASDKDTEGKFTWMTSGSDITFADWTPSNPSDSENNEDCVELNFAGDPVGWNDLNCNQTHNFICEA